ncbi:MAG TPA: sugar transferase [Tepidisphaeraceae bacterium]|nr:sugar transferase [Tepidisphaeraceae bacterium]
MIGITGHIKPARPTLWGLTPAQLHDHYWAAKGVHVVRQGQTEEVDADAEQYLLMDSRTLAMFRLRGLVDLLSWVRPDVLYVRLSHHHQSPYREAVVADGASQFVRFQRIYNTFDSRSARLVLTADLKLAQLWRAAPNMREAWKGIRQAGRHGTREVVSVRGRAYDDMDDESVAVFVRDLIQAWDHPQATISGIRRPRGNAWTHEDAQIDDAVRFIGSVWVGAGRKITGEQSVVGPSVLWDDPASRPAPRRVAWNEIEPVQPPEIRPVRLRRSSSFYNITKRAFDIFFSAMILLLTLPLYPVIIFAIWLEDGGPFFFSHARETLGGKEFGCIKFRSMRKDADAIQQQLRLQNQADGPQFFIDHDPRITRVGRMLRKLNLDELPQFVNVLLGQMSVVGPRPSPRKENQYCPPWREARLSVRPGITGLWQVMRTRQAGLDFQEWIRFDIQYVENVSWHLDLLIIWKTFSVLLRGVVQR